MADLKLNPQTTALILIDLQQGITSINTAPHPSAKVVANGVRLADAFRAKGATVILVRVAFAEDGSDRLATPTDEAMPPMKLTPEWSQLVPEIGPKPGDLVVTKRQWGAFYGTDLELHLRRRGISTIVIGGISTNFGVESTARDAWERSYALIFAEDAMSARSADAHTFAVSNIFPRLGRVRSTAEALKALGD